MLQLYQQFYRECGIRRFSELVSPRLELFRGFPRNAVYHHLSEDDEIFPDPSKPYFQGYFKRLPLELVYNSELMVGNPRKVPFVPMKFVLPFIREHRLFKFIPRISDIPTDDRTLAVIDYNPLKHSYRYVHTVMSDLQQWEGIHKTMWKTISDQILAGKKQHFVMLEPIKDLPSLNFLMNFGDKEGTALARIFNSNDKRFVLHLVNFLIPERRHLSVMSVIDEQALARVNIIFMLKDGRCSTVNLAYLYSWVKGDKIIEGFKVAAQYEERSVIRSLLKYFLIISASDPEEVSEQIPQDQTEEEPQNNETLEIPEDLDENPLTQEFSNKIRSEPNPKLQLQHASPAPLTKTEIAKKSTEPALPAHIDESLDQDLEILEKKNEQELHSRGLKLNNKELVEFAPGFKTYSHEEVSEQIQTAYPPNQVLRQKLERSLHQGDINAATYKKAIQDSEKYLKMDDPYETGKKVIERTKVDPKALAIEPVRTELKDHPTVFDKSMTKSTLQVYTNDYVGKHLHDDVLKMVGALQKGGVIVQRHEITMDHSVMGSAELHNIELKPINGAASSLWFRIPVIETDGTFKMAGNKYHMRKQRADLPIRKISSTEISLSSYYGKSFVSTESKMSTSSSAWVLKQINKAAFEGSEWISEVKPGNTFDSYAKVPYIFGLLSTAFISLKAGDLDLRFNNDENVKTKPPREGMRFCGYKSNTEFVWVDMNDQFFLTSKEGMLIPLGDIYKVLDLNPHDAPVRFSELALFRKNVPVGVVLGYRLGFSKLLALLKVKPRIVEPRTRLNLQNDEYPIPFIDYTYIFSRKDRFATMILAGYMEYAKITKNYETKDFEHPNVYLNLLSSKGLGAIYIREIDMLFDYFVDPITEEILQDMKEPTTFDGLLLRATEMLLSYQHPKAYDGAYTRIRGYERMPGAVYRELTAAVRSFRSRNIAGKSKIEISPWQVWQSLNEDPTKMLVPDINPIQDLKNDESITYVGEGGRSADGMNKASRSFHVSDVGVISEGTVDSSLVGVNISSSANPMLRNHRGLSIQDKGEVHSTNRHCSAVLSAPGAIHDDQNRINFISVQSSHTIPAKGYHPPYVRTGFESVIAQRVNPQFAYCAKEDGKVLKINDKGIIVEYKNGKKEGVELGRVFGKSEGSMFPFHIVADMKEGETFKKGEAIAYNTAYFQHDMWNPGHLVLKNSLVAKIALMETKQTHEDASSISKRLSEKLGTGNSYVRSFTIDFEQNLHNVLKVGTSVKPQDFLMSIEDIITSNLGSFGDAAIETLKGLAKQSPRVNYSGTVDRIEVFYHGDKDQMSPSLRKLADYSDAALAEQAKATGKPKYTGQVTDDYRVEGTPLAINRAEIRFYITVDTNMGVADKVVYANQMKSVNSEVMNYTMTTEDGEVIDGQFGCRSIAARNVMSPYIIGTANTLLKKFSQNAVKLFKQ